MCGDAGVLRLQPAVGPEHIRAVGLQAYVGARKLKDRKVAPASSITGRDLRVARGDGTAGDDEQTGAGRAGSADYGVGQGDRAARPARRCARRIGLVGEDAVAGEVDPAAGVGPQARAVCAVGGGRRTVDDKDPAAGATGQHARRVGCARAAVVIAGGDRAAAHSDQSAVGREQPGAAVSVDVYVGIVQGQAAVSARGDRTGGVVAIAVRAQVVESDRSVRVRENSGGPRAIGRDARAGQGDRPAPRRIGPIRVVERCVHPAVGQRDAAACPDRLDAVSAGAVRIDRGIAAGDLPPAIGVEAVAVVAIGADHGPVRRSADQRNRTVIAGAHAVAAAERGKIDGDAAIASRPRDIDHGRGVCALPRGERRIGATAGGEIERRRRSGALSERLRGGQQHRRRRRPDGAMATD